MEFAPQSRIGSFEVVSLLGTGGMGTVYKARDLDLARDVAINMRIVSMLQPVCSMS